MSNNKIDCYFKKRCSQDSTSSPILETSSTVISETSKLSDDQTSIPESSPTKVRKHDQDSNCLNIECDPGLRNPIWDCSTDERNKIRCAYLKVGPYQGIPENSLQYVDRNGRRFLPTWYKTVVAAFIGCGGGLLDELYAVGNGFIVVGIMIGIVTIKLIFRRS
ncbi:hypothetical protein BUALT_Bualt04G0044800 [Buddleja alternifolia]|uniref:Uncharacterized protein n=1 Tax=Buddleja alternifolia TaxID=168488 RepID=A0AAV6XQP3_9LAMI|nr:hypothetical protein BUALT_Bualt04G0044800 [Buddleja alternifolia]